ncbi:MAG: alpha/beta hydrolase [Microvirga sp.]|jgi:arylformamidase|nr:alpha/beta hydrolase [Microvirga sp.]
MTEDVTKVLDRRSQAELDSAFTLDSIPDLESVVARRARAAQEGLAAFKAVRNIRYGTRAEETLNLFPAQGVSGPSPVHVFIHGGFWRSMEAAQFSFLAPGFVPFGAALAVIDYPLIPAVRLRDIVASCRRAICWVHHHGSEYELDPGRIFISGNSAGGHLVAELMDRNWTAEAGLPCDAIKGGTAISGLYDLATVAASFQNDTLRLTADDILDFSPLRRTVNIDAPVVAAVGGNETDEFLRQTADYAAALRAAGVAVSHMVVPNTDHITVVLDALADPAAELNRAVRCQMGLA